MNRKAIIILLTLFGLLFWWVSAELSQPAVRNEYTETPQERERIVKRMNYHGLTGHFTVMRESSSRGLEFLRQKDGQWCRL